MPVFFIFMNNRPKKIIFLTKALILSLAAFSVLNYAKASEITSENIIKLVNQSRENNNLSPLVKNEKLKEIAQSKVNDMIEKNYFAHTSPSGIVPWYWYQKEGYDYKYAGENLAINFLTSEEEHQAWMNSVTHRKNILNPEFQEIGVAVAAGDINGQTSMIAVQEFGTLLSGSIPVDQSKNFSGKEKTNIVKEGVKITPQVLSSKDMNENPYNKPADSFSSDWENNATELFQVISIMMVMLALFLAPLAFLATATNKILLITEENKKIIHVK